MIENIIRVQRSAKKVTKIYKIRKEYKIKKLYKNDK